MRRGKNNTKTCILLLVNSKKPADHYDLPQSVDKVRGNAPDFVYSLSTLRYAECFL